MKRNRARARPSGNRRLDARGAFGFDMRSIAGQTQKPRSARSEFRKEDFINHRNIVFATFCLANIAISFSFAALAAAVSVISRDLSVSDIIVSRISAYYMIPYGLGALLYAPLSKRFSFKIILAATMVMYAVTNLICATAHSMDMILWARIFMGLAAASVVPLCLISIGALFPKEIRGRLVGLFFSTSFMASVSGIIVSGIFPWRWLFILPAVLSVLTALGVMIGGDIHPGEKPLGRIDYLKVLNNADIRNVLIFIFTISFLYHGVHKWLGVYLNRMYHVEQWTISLFFMLIAIFGAIGQNVGGYITDKKGRYIACQIGVSILSLMTMLLLGTYPLVVLGIILSLFSVGWTIGHNGVSTVLTDFPDENRAEIASLNSAVRFFSGGLGFFLGGSFVEKNFGLTFFGFGVLMLISLGFLKKIIPQEL